MLGHWRLHFSAMEEGEGVTSIVLYSLWCEWGSFLTGNFSAFSTSLSCKHPKLKPFRFHGRKIHATWDSDDRIFTRMESWNPLEFHCVKLLGKNDIVLLKYSFMSRPTDSPGTQWPCSIKANSPRGRLRFGLALWCFLLMNVIRLWKSLFVPFGLVLQCVPWTKFL